MCVTDILSDSAGEKERRLRHDDKLTMIGVQIEAANVAIVDEQFATLVLIEAGDEIGQAGFTRAGMPDDCNGLAWLNGQIKVGQHTLAVIIAEEKIAELDLSAQLLYRLGRHPGKPWRGVEPRHTPFASYKTKHGLSPRRAHSS